MSKTLNTSVAVENVWYRPGDRVGDQIPEDVAEKITNPRVWTYDDGEEPKAEEPKSTTGAQLVSRVAVAGQWYGPGDDVPDDVARKITNPKVWEDGKAPFAEEKKTAKAKAETEQKPADEPDAQADAQTPTADTAEDTDDAGGDRRPARRGRRA